VSVVHLRIFILRYTNVLIIIIINIIIIKSVILQGRVSTLLSQCKCSSMPLLGCPVVDEDSMKPVSDISWLRSLSALTLLGQWQEDDRPIETFATYPQSFSFRTAEGIGSEGNQPNQVHVENSHWNTWCCMPSCVGRALSSVKASKWASRYITKPMTQLLTVMCDQEFPFNSVTLLLQRQKVYGLLKPFRQNTGVIASWQNYIFCAYI